MPRPPAHSQKFYSSLFCRLPEDLILPRLPPITDKKLEAVATTHTSFYRVSKFTFDLDVDKYTEILDYEKLEFIGDKIIGMCADLAVHELHPNMRQGMATKLHDCLVQNETLAQLSERYGIIDMLKTSADMGYLTKMQVKTKGSVFESYVAGVFYSFMSAGPPGSEEEIGHEDHGKLIESTAIQGAGGNASLPTLLKASSGCTNDTGDKSTNAVKAVRFSNLNINDSADKEEDEEDPPQGGSSGSSTDLDSSDEADDGPSECGSNMLEILYAEPDSDNAEFRVSRKDAQATSFKSTESQSVKIPQPSLQASQKASVIDGGRTEGQAFDYVYAWLKPLFIPMTQFFIREMQRELSRIQNDEVATLEQAAEKKMLDEQIAGGATAALITYCENYFGRQPEYEIVRARPGVWKATCTIKDFEGKEYSGVGEKATKRMAKMVASYQVAVQLKLWK